MVKIRVVKTASGAKAVQVIRYANYSRRVLRHIGSAHTEQELKELMVLAQEWIKAYGNQLSIFPDEDPNKLLHLNHCTFIGVKYHYFYSFINNLFDAIGLDTLPVLLKDLAIIRIFEPASKLRSLELLERYFDVTHSRKTYYQIAPQYEALKQLAEGNVVRFAQQHYHFNFDIVFYDVTTLYFETFEEDELRKNGFSKDNKSQQPQILIALVVSKEGLPIAYEVFSGNTFEGHTFLPVIKNFIDKNGIETLTVVADAAMISTENVKQLQENGLHYIVGARLGNLPTKVIDQIDKSMDRQDGKSIRIKTDNGYLICSYCAVRYRKDLYEMNKQIEKAKQVIEKPSKNKKLKFTQTHNQRIELNEALIEKTKKLLGIKGYYTNLKEDEAGNSIIIERYHQLYKIEQAFRIAKSDLQTRPVFHFKEQPIKLHVLICYIALVATKHIELSTGSSIRKFLDLTKKVVDGQLLNHATGKIVNIKAQPNTSIIELVKKLNIPH